MTWTPERIAAVRERLDRYVSWHSDDADPEARRLAQSADDVATLARIGVAVVEARPETVERVARALCAGVFHPDERDDLGVVRWTRYADSARSVLAAISRGV